MPLVRQMSGAGWCIRNLRRKYYVADDAELQAGYMEFCQIIGSIENRIRKKLDSRKRTAQIAK